MLFFFETNKGLYRIKFSLKYIYVMNLIVSHDAILSIVYDKTQDRGGIFIAIKIRAAEMKGYTTVECPSAFLCCINQLEA